MFNISENNINSIVADAEEQQWRERDSESITVNRNLFTDICQSSSIFIFLIIIAIITSKFIFFEYNFIVCLKIFIKCYIRKLIIVDNRKYTSFSKSSSCMNVCEAFVSMMRRCSNFLKIVCIHYRI